MTDTPIHASAPTPVGDVVPGDPPVPITVWLVPAPRVGDTMSNPLGKRLVHNLTYPADLIIDLTVGPQLARAVIAGGRRSQLPTGNLNGREPAALIVTGWPPAYPDLPEMLGQCFARLRPGGCLALVLGHHDPTIPADLIATARRARLSYLQHVVAATELVGGAPPRIHTDVLVLTRTRRHDPDITDEKDPHHA
jgi:hypothetical protein